MMIATGIFAFVCFTAVIWVLCCWFCSAKEVTELKKELEDTSKAYGDVVESNQVLASENEKLRSDHTRIGQRVDRAILSLRGK